MAAKTMRAVAIKGGKGPADALYHTEIPVPELKACEALVQVKAFGLNRMDIIQRNGQYPLPPQAPETLGVEFAGVIVQPAKEPGKNDFKVGDEVLGLAYGGAYAEYIAVSARMLAHKPRELSFEQAAGIPETWITALQAMYLVGEFAPGKSILWHAGASSVSIAGIQLSRADGASAVYVTAGSDEKVDMCINTLGATAGFNYRTTPDWASAIRDITKDKAGVDVIIDFVGAPYFQGNVNLAARDARVVFLGQMGGSQLPEGIDIKPLLFKRIRMEGSTLRSRDEQYQGKLRDILEEKVLPGVVDGSFKVLIDKVMPWEQIVDAHKLMESNTTKGKIICTIN